MSECVVIGGGVAGLLSCYALAVSGARVCLLERAEVGRESSWAGGGIVSPLYPWRYAAAVQQLAIWSQRFYPALGERLLRESGLDPEVYTTGLYWLDLHDADAALVWGAAHAGALREVCMSEVYDKLPNLRRGFSSAVFSSDVANVRNPKLLKALASSLRQMPNVRVLENAKVEKLALSGGRVAGVLVGGELLAAEKVIIAAGAWSAELLVSLGLMLPVAPVKGQMILYKCEPDFLPAMVLAEERYAIPRRDGHVLVGSTLEHVGFDKTPTEGALVSLKVSAEKMLPGLAQREVVGHWAGLRPGSPDGIPFIGEVQEVPGLWLNCGHYRNGLVLAPASCELLKNLMLGEVPIVDPLPYSPAGRLGIL